MKTIFLIISLFSFLKGYAHGDTINYYDNKGRLTDAQRALYSMKHDGDYYEGYYLNNKPYFKGRISFFDTSSDARHKYRDTCTWYYKNGLIRNMNIYNSDGKLHGISRWYFESGSLWKEYSYNNDLIENNTYVEFLEDGQRQDIFEDHFDNNSSDWELSQNDNEDVRIENGFLTLNAKTKSGTSRYKYIKFNKQDFVIESDLHFINNRKENKGGIIFGFKDWDNFNFFYINKGNFFIGSVHEGIRQNEIDDMFSNAIKENGSNTLKIISSGDQFIYTVNGKLVYKSSRTNFHGNYIGVAMLGKFMLRVDRFVFKQVSYSSMGSGAVARELANTDVKSTGTGFFVHPSGIIATNFHVIENERQLLVDVMDTLNGLYKSFKAEVLIKDMENDLALLKITDKYFKPFFDKIYYTNATSNSFELGSSVYTLGFPLALAGMGSSEVKFSDGRISAKTGYNGVLNSFQTTIPVQAGSSGGPIFNQEGQLIGVINSKISRADNVSYGIKNNFLINLIQSLPDSIEMPAEEAITGISFEEKVARMKKYIVLIKVK